MAAHPIRTISICSGVGGLDIGVNVATHQRCRTICYMENEAFCAAVLQARMGEGLDEAPIWNDVRTFDGKPWRGAVDLIVGGFPCQGFSVAGKRRGKHDERHLWPYIAEHIAVIRPAACFFENVTGLLTLGFEQVCEDLSRMGYAVEAGIYSAEECGAPHRRERLFFFAHTTGAGRQACSGDGLRIEPPQKQRLAACRDSSSVSMADADRKGQPQQSGLVGKVRRRASDSSARQIVEPMGLPASRPADLVAHVARGWPADWEDGVPRTTEGEPHLIDKLRALGNAVVPATAAKAFTELSRRAGFDWCD